MEQSILKASAIILCTTAGIIVLIFVIIAVLLLILSRQRKKLLNQPRQEHTPPPAEECPRCGKMSFHFRHGYHWDGCDCDGKSTYGNVTLSECENCGVQLMKRDDGKWIAITSAAWRHHKNHSVDIHSSESCIVCGTTAIHVKSVRTPTQLEANGQRCAHYIAAARCKTCNAHLLKNDDDPWREATPNEWHEYVARFERAS